MCCLTYDRPSSPHLRLSHRYPKYYDVQRPPKAQTHHMEYTPHVKKPERKHTHHEAQRRPKARRQNEEYVPRGRKPEVSHYSHQEGSALSTDCRRHNSQPISPNSTIHSLSHNSLIPNRFANLSAVSSLQPDDIQDTNPVQAIARMRAPRARVAQVIDRPATKHLVISRPPPAVVHKSKPEPPPTIKPRKRSVQAETKHRLSRPWNDMTEWPPAHNPNRLSKPFSDMPAFYRGETPPPPPTIAQRRREKKKTQAEKQEHMLWHGVSPPRKDSPLVKEQLGVVKGKRGQDVWYYQMSLG